MKTPKPLSRNLIAVPLLLAGVACAGANQAPRQDGNAQAIPWSQIGARPVRYSDRAETSDTSNASRLTDAEAGKRLISWGKAGADYKGDGLAVLPTEAGARLRCVFQRLEGEATSEGLWLTSTASDPVKDRFRVVATAIGRSADFQSAVSPNCIRQGGENTASARANTGGLQIRDTAGCKPALPLPRTGSVALDGHTVRFIRSGLVEEYSVSVDGVRQDFIVERPPEAADHSTFNAQPSTLNPASELRVDLELTGARAEQTAHGATLALKNSGRKIAYSRLQVTDATGNELPARMEVAAGILPDSEGAHPAARSSADNVSMASLQDTPPSAGLEAAAHRQARTPAATTLAVLVNDTDAVYPIRIDPTFSDNNWISMGGIPGADSDLLAATVDAAGNLYVGGFFTGGVAKWDGSSWSSLGSGISGGDPFTVVNAMTVSGGDLYVAGMFSTAGQASANNIAKWDGNSWSALGSGMDANTIAALLILGSDLYAGGTFTEAGGVSANNIAKWNGSNWSALGAGIDGSASALAVLGGALFVGGSFTTAGGNPAANMAKWDGSTWSALGSGTDGSVSALAVSGSNLFAGGEFTTAGGITASKIAKWDGGSWTPLGSGMDGTVFQLAVSGSNLVAGGEFTTAGGTAAAKIAKWGGSSWSALGSNTAAGLFEHLAALAASGDHLYAVGGYTTPDFTARGRIAQWDGSTWSGVGWGIDEPVYALAVAGSDVYVGGSFSMAGDTPASRIAKWNGSSWSALGLGLNGSVTALVVSGGDLYAGGTFTTATNSGGTSITVNRIARWDGSNWSSLGSGMSGGDPGYLSGVFALAVSGGDVYAGGSFTSVNGVSARNIAKWDGSNWSPLGSGVTGSSGFPQYGGPVRALAVSGGDLYAGGLFTTAGGNTANRIAKWNGSVWSALGSGMNNTVWALAVSGSTLYAGGSFTTAGGGTVNRIAKWSGTAWSALGPGVGNTTGDVYSLAVSGGNLYVGGANFTNAGAVSASRIAKWDGDTWSALGTGINNSVLALAALGNELYAGGRFTMAGGKFSTRLARARLSFTPDNLSLQANFPGMHTNTLTFAGVPNHPYIVEYATNLTDSPWFTLSTNTPAANGVGTALDPAATDPQRFYRVGYQE